MLGTSARIPKVISVRVKCAEGLKIIPKSDHKQKKLTQKWKVHFVGGKKKMSTSSVLDTYGNPQWDYEVTFKLASKSDPVVLLVTDSEDHHVGQVVVPLVTIPPRPPNVVERPTDSNRLRRADLEPTKKVASPHGMLYYWIWVEEYRSEESDSKSSRGSMLSISSSKNKRASSVADSLNYSGSVISVGSTQGDKKEKKHHLFKKRHGKDLLASAAAVSTRRLSGMSNHNPPLSRSMGSVFDPTNRGNPLPHQSEYSHEDHDGSILGAGSDLTGSEFYANALMLRSSNQQPQQSRHDSEPQSQISIPVPSSRASYISPEGTRRISPVREEPVEQERGNTMQFAQPPQKANNASPETRPQLLRLSPNSCPTTGGVEVTVSCFGLTEEMMRYASVLVDGYTVPRQDWFLQETARSNHSELRIHMPERPTGQCWIELETMHHGRIRCPQEFQYTTPVPKESTATTASEAPEPGQRPLSRMGSQRSSLLVRDRRSTRRSRPPTGDIPSTESNGQTETSRSSVIRSSIPITTTSSSVAADATAPSPFIRHGSTRDSVSVVDRRSSRRRISSNTSILPSKEPIVLVESNENNTDSAAMFDDYTVHYDPGVSPYDPTGGSSPFSRSGSRQSSLRVSDRRSLRLRSREHLPLPEVQNDAKRSVTSPTNKEPNCHEVESPLSEQLAVTIPVSGLESTTSVPDRLLSKQLTPVFEDAETPMTPNTSSMVADSSADKQSINPVVGPESATLFSPNRAKRSMITNDQEHNASAEKKKAREVEDFNLEERNNPAVNLSETAAFHEPQTSEYLRLSSNMTVTQFSHVPPPVVSEIDLTPNQSPKVDHRDYSDQTPTNMDSPPYVWDQTPEREMNPCAEAIQNSHVRETNQIESSIVEDAFRRQIGSPSGSLINGGRIDPRSSVNSGSLFSLNSLEVAPKPIASKSPSLIRASYSRGSEMSESASSHSENAEIPSDDDELEEMEEMEDEVQEVDDAPGQSYSYNYNSRSKSTLDEEDEEEEVNQHTDSQIPRAKSSFAQPTSQQDSGVESMKENVSPFIRTGSQRSSIRIQDRRSTRRRPPSLLPNAVAIPAQTPPKQPESPPLSDDIPTERYEASGEAGSESNLSADNSPLDHFQGYSARRRNSHRSEASGQSRSMLDEHSKLETETLRSMLSEANNLIDNMKKQTLELEKQLSEKTADVDRLSLELCQLRLRLLEGGATQFLEKCF
ncbi:C2 domain [Fasciola gigantica]|uniref:C2 domain n=1 Tax=Fasciola gigantica TaxID=46835 RepID=A0A504YE87_FASGI|nr:C2 domain [Fasciola gigantica]